MKIVLDTKKSVEHTIATAKQPTKHRPTATSAHHAIAPATLPSELVDYIVITLQLCEVV